MERELHSRLKKGETPDEIAEDLLRSFIEGQLPPEQWDDALNFLRNNRNSAELYRWLAEDALSSREPRWQHIVAALASVLPATDPIWTVVQTGAVDTSAETSAGFTWPTEDHPFRTRLLRQREAELQSRKEHLRSKLEFVRSQRLEDQEGPLLEELSSLAPNDPELQKEWHTYRVRWAKKVVNQAAVEMEALPQKGDPAPVALRLAVLEELGETPSSRLDLALLLHWVEDPEGVIQILRSHLQRHPIFLDLLMAARGASGQWLEALEDIRGVEALGTFPHGRQLIYYKALCLHEMGHGMLAIELMEQVVSDDPHYRQGEHLLTLWKEAR